MAEALFHFLSLPSPHAAAPSSSRSNQYSVWELSGDHPEQECHAWVGTGAGQRLEKKKPEERTLHAGHAGQRESTCAQGGWAPSPGGVTSVYFFAEKILIWSLGHLGS